MFNRARGTNLNKLIPACQQLVIYMHFDQINCRLLILHSLYACLASDIWNLPNHLDEQCARRISTKEHYGDFGETSRVI